MVEAAPSQAAERAPITSRAELTHYLETTPPGTSPLGWLSPGGRKRFLASLEFGSRGLEGFSHDDPDHELTHAQIVQLFTLFGIKDYAEGLGLTEDERIRFERERLAAANARGCAVASCPESAIEQRYDKLVLQQHDSSSPTIERFARIGRQYDHLFAGDQTPRKLRSLDDIDLRLLVRAAGIAVFYEPSSRHIAQLQMDLAEMQRRDLATDRDFVVLYRAWVATRQFAKAAALARQHPGMSVHALPTLLDSAGLPPGQPTALAIAMGGRTMTRQAFDLSTPVRIVVVASCHFSQDAAHAIEGDAQLRSLFTRHAIWLADQSASVNEALQWNRQFPGQPIHIAWKNSEWSKLDDWGMPTFYVFRHGTLVDKWSGWPTDAGGIQTVRQRLHKDGLL